MIPGTRLVKADCPEPPSPTLQRRYRCIIDSISYLVQMMRCDMAFAYDQLSLFLHNPGPVHMTVAELALAYVRGTHDQGLSCCDPGAENQNVLTGWVDSDFAADSDTRRSVTGYVMALNGAPISWRSFLKGSPQVKLNMSLPAPSPRRTPTSTLFYQASTLPSWPHMLVGRQCCIYSYE